MTLRMRLAVTAITLGLVISSGSVLAQDDFKLIPSNNTRNLLVHQMGTVVTLQLSSGKELTGTVTSVGEFLVQLSRLSGRDFYDAAVKISQIEAVIIKARSK